jgi:DNA-directed RNA polymerase specialized sigma24 family protein
MARVDDFDAFYHATRRPLLHQTYALSGNAEHAVTAVEHAFAQAWSEWRKVRRLPDPVSWVRSEAWRVAGSPLPRRRWGLRGFRRTDRRRFVMPAESAHAADLQALRDLPDGQRRAVVLHHLAELPVDRIALESGISEASAAFLLAQGEQAWADTGTSIDAALQRIEADLAGVRLIRAPSLRRSGERRHRQQTLVGVATAAALLVGGGFLIVNDGPATIKEAAADAPHDGPADTSGAASAPTESAPATQPPSPSTFLLDERALLTRQEMKRLTRQRADWSVTSTTDGTTGDPIYAPCQQEPFADPDGKQSLLRRFEASDDGLSAVQVIEESRSERQSTLAFDRMESWYSRCDDDGVQLQSTMGVHGIGDEARAFRLRDIGKNDTYVTVGIVRTGPITTAVIASAKDERAVAPMRVLTRAGVSVTRMCLPVSGDCTTQPRVKTTTPLPTGQNPGFLAAYDLPTISNVSAPWVGTDPARSLDNPAATPCERANFGRPQRPRTRVFVLPTAKKLPQRFGLAETVGTFRTPANARSFLKRAYDSADSCPDRELSASDPIVGELPAGSDGRVWRFEFEVNENASVYYRVGLVRSGPRVALLSMSPSETYDVSRREFVNVVVRAGQRLTEADAAGRSGGSGGADSNNGAA